MRARWLKRPRWLNSWNMRRLVLSLVYIGGVLALIGDLGSDRLTLWNALDLAGLLVWASVALAWWRAADRWRLVAEAWAASAENWRQAAIAAGAPPNGQDHKQS